MLEDISEEDVAIFIHSGTIFTRLPCSLFFLYLKSLSLYLCMLQPPSPPLYIHYIQKHMRSIFMPFHHSSLISLRLSPQRDNA